MEESVPSYVTWRAAVDAQSETKAIEKFIEGEYDGNEEGPLFEDAIDSLPMLRDAHLRDDKEE